MILFFSGTGNTHAVSLKLAQFLGEPLINFLKISPDRLIFEGERLIFTFPIYSWGVAPILLKYLESLNSEFIKEVKTKDIYVVCTCGDDTGKAPEMFEKSLEIIGLKAKGIWSVQMPNNYVLLPGFDVDSKEVENDKLAAYAERVIKIAEVISRGEAEKDYVPGKFPGLKTKVVYPLFKKWGIIPSKWKSTEECIGCGLCQKYCQTNNITLKNGRPEWGSDCISCLSCYHVCPKKAIQYGKATINKGQYMFPTNNKKI